ncbi:MAG: OmpH family outer membrane protein [Pirellulaceae bacterium]|nr:OmpH family outer membrane protein [Pirellulaceae bacterium]
MRNSLVFGRSWTKFVFLTAVACGALVALDAISDDQPANERTPRVPVAVIDVARVFKEDREFQRKLDKVKAEIAEFEGKVSTLHAKIKEMQPKNEGSDLPSGEQAERQLKAAQLQAALTAEITVRKQAFLLDESHIYYDRYQALEAAVEKVARERDVALVMRHNSEPMNPGDRSSVLQGVNRAIIYSRVPDLTVEVIKALNGVAAQTKQE